MNEIVRVAASYWMIKKLYGVLGNLETLVAIYYAYIVSDFGMRNDVEMTAIMLQVSTKYFF